MSNATRSWTLGLAGLAGMLTALTAGGAEGIWVPTTGGGQTWPVATNWTGITTYPMAAGDTAVLTNNLAAPQTINLGGTITIGAIRFGDHAAPYYPFTIGPTAALTLDVAAGPVTIVKSGEGADNIATPVTLSDNLIVSNLQNSVSQPLVLSGAISGAKSLTVDGAGADSTVEFSYPVTTQVPARCGRAPEGIGPSQSLQHGV